MVFRSQIDNVDVDSLELLESRRDGAKAEGDAVAAPWHELALYVGDVHEQFLVGVLQKKVK